jgi:hypothetical protein
MDSDHLSNLVRIGVLKVEPGDQAEFDGLVRSGVARLMDARNEALSAESRFDLAYNAAHALSLAALRWHGFRPNKQRYVVFQALEHTLGELPTGLRRVLDKCHGLRNLAEYQGEAAVDLQLLGELIAAVQAVREAVGRLGPIGDG